VVFVWVVGSYGDWGCFMWLLFGVVGSVFPSLAAFSTAFMNVSALVYG
jgi:hypothetical protein